MKRWFICPDGDKIEIAECYKTCRMKERCAPLSYLHRAGEFREWTGKPSCTQLLGGTREAYLMLTTDWAVDPEKSAWMILGSAGHAVMEHSGHDEISEMVVMVDGITGRLDFLEKNEEGTYDLNDYKVVGSYAVAKALGVEIVKTPKLDDSGEQLMWHGKPRMDTVVTLNPDKADLRDWALQVNFYRIGAEKGGVPIRQMRLFMIPRDGGTVVAKSRGITRQTYFIPVPVMDDERVMTFFGIKRDALIRAMVTGEWPLPCTAQEAWDGNKCRGYCPVVDACVRHGDNPFIDALTERRDDE